MGPADRHGRRLRRGERRRPAPWTTYQQFGYAFSPDCTAGVTALTSAFLDSPQGGAPVMLTSRHRVGTNPPRTDAEPPAPCASTR
ncbi:hypothetical protein [Streptomyces sp. MNU76]|uniref:hypothetical protein n=1 Tax=Streptomyces sp. MNU76 TaxID=2560026 RepID=UPI0035A8E746